MGEMDLRGYMPWHLPLINSIPLFYCNALNPRKILLVTIRNMIKLSKVYSFSHANCKIISNNSIWPQPKNINFL